MKDKHDEANTMLSRRTFLKQGAQVAVVLPVAGALLTTATGVAATAPASLAPAAAPSKLYRMQGL